MACPYFYPVSRLNTNFWAVPPRCPLGDLYTGVCRSPDADSSPDEKTLREFCNFGYGRSRCKCFPITAKTDALRFQIVGEFGDVIRIHYVSEKDCWPVAYGTADLSITTNEFTAAPEDEILRRQTAVFVESYRRRKVQ